MLIDILLVMSISVGSALFAEGLNWLLIYRKDDYKKLKATIERLQSKLDQEKSVTMPAKQKSKEKKQQLREDKLKDANRDMALAKMKSTFAVGFTMIALFAILNTSFDGRVVAKLPFTPFNFITGLSHRSLSGTDYTECSMVFMYVLCSLSIRSNLQRLMGVPQTKQTGAIF